jgi:aldose 1-epimerase
LMPTNSSSTFTVERQPFGPLADGREAELFTLSNGRGLRAEISNYGATIVRLWVPDREGTAADVVLGYDTLAEYEGGTSYHGAVVGRYGNRIAGGKFSLDGRDYSLPLNDDPGGLPCSLHGGPEGFDRQVWSAATRIDADAAVLELTHLSPDGHAGYPGNLNISVTYRLNGDNGLQVIYRATTDAPTLINPTQHAYFNLAGGGAGKIDDHILQLAASKFLPVNAGMIPLGEMERAVGTPFDFFAPRPIGSQLTEEHAQLELAGGYDHTYVFDDQSIGKKVVAQVLHRKSGRLMEVWTTEPGLQFYTGNSIPEGEPGKAGAIYGPRAGLCLETQHFPDSPHHPGFPSTELRPGGQFHSETEFCFAAV